MQHSNICKKISSMLALYVDAKLDFHSSKLVREHLKNCNECRNKYLLLRKLISDLNDAYKELIKEAHLEEESRKFYIKEYENFHANISSYFDNELTLSDSLDIKKYLIKFPNARKELEEMYNLHRLVINTSLAVEKSCNTDFSKKICQEISGKNPFFDREIAMKVAVFTGIIILFGALIGIQPAITKVVKEKGVDFLKRTIYVNSSVDINFNQDYPPNK